MIIYTPYMYPWNQRAAQVERAAEAEDVNAAGGKAAEEDVRGPHASLAVRLQVGIRFRDQRDDLSSCLAHRAAHSRITWVRCRMSLSVAGIVCSASHALRTASCLADMGWDWSVQHVLKLKAPAVKPLGWLVRQT